MGFTRPNYNNLNTSKFEIGDPITDINVNLDPTNPNNTDIGFIFNRGITGYNVALLWDKSAQEFIFCSTSATGDDEGDLPINDYSDLRINVLTANNVVSGNLTFPVFDGTAGQAIITDGNGTLSFHDVADAWGTISGTLSDQTDLQNALDTKLDGNSLVNGGTF